MSTVKSPVSVICVFLWIGFVCAISFMEAWLKFRAPGVTLPLGLGIGRIVFSALNRVEWVFAVVLLFNRCHGGEKVFGLKDLFFVIPFLILVLQTVWLLPGLDQRAEMHIRNEVVPSSNLHFYYVGAELIKVVGLFVFGTRLFKKII